MRNCDDLIRGEAIVCVSSIDWDFIWHWQEIMLRLANAGNPVLFVENTGVRTPGLRDLPRLISRLRNWGKGVQGFRELAPNLIVLSPLLLPFPYSRIARGINAWLLSRAISKWLSASKHSSPILWTFLPTPLVHDIIAEVDPALVVYYCADNFAATSPGAKSIESSERELFRKANLVFVNSRSLQERALQFRESAPICPIGVNFKLFEAFRESGIKEPEDISSIPRPRFGYIGGLHRWVDMELLHKAAFKRPDYHFVLIGPEQTDAAPLRGIPNIHLLGRRAHDTLPSYIGSFDAGLIPYRLAEYTSSVYPAKLNEYFAMGIPVISTALSEVVAYNEAHQGVVSVARDTEDFISRLDASLRGAEVGRPARIEASRRNSWAVRLTEMSARMIEALDSKRATPQIMSGLLRRLARRYQTATIATALIMVFFWGIVRWTPLAWRLSEGLRLVQPPISADAIVVLAGGAGESGEVGRGHEERVGRAIELYREGYAKKIVLCSAEKRTFSELEVMRAIALTKGVQDSDILMGRGGGTHQMVAGADKLIRQHGWKRVLLVSSPYHMKRAILVWKKQQSGLEVIATPVRRSNFYDYSDESVVNGYRPGPTWTQLRGLLWEAAALAYYVYRGWI